MQAGTSPTVRADLSVFLGEHLGKLQSGDVGALLGQAALLSDSAAADETMPEGWHEAMNAALSEASSGATSAHDERAAMRMEPKRGAH